MLKFRFVDMKAEELDNISSLLGLDDKPKELEAFRNEVQRCNRFVFALRADEGFIGEVSLDMNTGDELTVQPLKRLYISSVNAVSGELYKDYMDILIEYSVNKAVDIGCEEMTVAVDKSETRKLAILKRHAFTQVLSENGSEVRLLRNIKEVSHCCGS